MLALRINRGIETFAQAGQIHSRLMRLHGVCPLCMTAACTLARPDDAQSRSRKRREWPTKARSELLK
jgi:hypothetical protein